MPDIQPRSRFPKTFWVANVRTAQRMVAELAEAGYLATTRQGRRNLYVVNGLLPRRHPIEEQNSSDRKAEPGRGAPVIDPAPEPAQGAGTSPMVSERSPEIPERFGVVHRRF